MVGLYNFVFLLANACWQYSTSPRQESSCSKINSFRACDPPGVHLRQLIMVVLFVSSGMRNKILNSDWKSWGAAWGCFMSCMVCWTVWGNHGTCFHRYWSALWLVRKTNWFLQKLGKNSCQEVIGIIMISVSDMLKCAGNHGLCEVNRGQHDFWVKSCLGCTWQLFSRITGRLRHQPMGLQHRCGLIVNQIYSFMYMMSLWPVLWTVLVFWIQNVANKRREK